MIKIAFFDNDGTLLRFHHTELEENIRYTLKKLQEKGILICMATGRGIMGIPHFKDIDFDIYLTFNGSYVVDNKGKIIRDNPIPKDDVKKIYNNLKKMNREVAIASTRFLVASGNKDEDLKEYFSFSKEPINPVSNFDEYLEKDVYQMMCGCRKQDHEKIIDNTKDAKVTAWWDKAADIIPESSGKGKAVEAVLKYYGFTKEEAIAFGDGMNDIDMLDAVGTAVVMDNAKEEVKKHADEICKSVDEDGIYDYCLKHLLI